MRLTILLVVLIGVVLVPEVNGFIGGIPWGRLVRMARAVYTGYKVARTIGKREAALLDINKDGLIDQSEAMRILDERDANAFLPAADTNGDGKVSLKEFRDGMEKIMNKEMRDIERSAGIDDDDEE